MQKKFTLFISLLALAACDGGGNDRYDVAPAPAMEYAEDQVVVTGKRVRSEAANMSAPQSGEGGSDQAVTDTRQLAYEYYATLSLPPETVAAVKEAHEERCRQAGASVCQIVSSSINEANEDYVNGTLVMRAAPDWMTPFRDGLEAEAEGAEGRLTSMSAAAEDLSRAITDTTARLEAQKTLRERLLRLLERETDKVGDLLQIERELARVQSEIESAESYLKVLRARVAMDKITVNYQSIPKAVSNSTVQPLLNAFRDFFGVLSRSIASVILFVAAALPWIIIGIPALWIPFKIVTRWRRKRKA